MYLVNVLIDVVIFCHVIHRAESFCYNTRAIIDFVPENKTGESYFGYTTLIRQDGHSTLMVGAPRDNVNSPNYKDINNSGTIYSCSIDLNKSRIPCPQKILDYEGNIRKKDALEIYKHKKDDMWLGMSMSGTTENGPFIACAPRWIDNNRDDYYNLNGLCYALGDKNVEQLVPLTIDSKQDYEYRDLRNSTYYYRYGQVGFSSEISKSGKELLLGAPGIHIWTGSVVKYTISNNAYDVASIPNPSNTNGLEEMSYLGYSVGFGTFLSGRELYVAGAPRGSDYRGEVYVFDFPSHEESAGLNIKTKLIGKNMGEYFGSTIGTVDINQDGLTDLIIGAPLYAEENKWEMGRVYVYINTDKGEFEEEEGVICGSCKVAARFGMSISEIGDINDDGYIDVAIGAPYEDGHRGAVYIYLGSNQGLNPVYVQRISFDDLSGFGISISKGVDVDSNSCKDIAIGAFMSNRVILLRCHPSIGIKPSITTTPEQLRLNTTDFTAHICMEIIGTHVTDLNVKVSIDPTYKRATLENPSDETFIMKGALPKVCKDVNVTMTSIKLDYSKPIEIRASYQQAHNPMQDNIFCSNCAVLRPTMTRELIESIPVESGCENGLECRPDLKLHIQPLFDIPYIIGSNQSLKINVSLENLGEPAFITVIKLKIPLQVSLSRVPPECSMQDDLLSCEMPNPFIDNKTMSLEFSKVRLSNSDKQLIFNITAVSRGIETTPEDNSELLIVPLKSIANITIIGKSTPSQIQVNKPTFDKLIYKIGIVKNLFEVINAGPSPLDEVVLMLFVPLMYRKDEDKEYFFVNVEKPKATLSNIPIICRPVCGSFDGDAVSMNKSVIASMKSTQRKYAEDMHRLPSEQETSSSPIHITCADTERVLCVILQCEASLNMIKNNEFKVDFTINFHQNIIEELIEDKQFITYSAHAMAKSPFIHNNYSTGSTQIYFNNESYTHPAPIWLIVLSIILGILTLSVLIYALHRIGFFKREAKDKISLLKNQENENIEAEAELTPEIDEVEG